MSWQDILKEDGMEYLISTMQEAFENHIKKYGSTIFKGVEDIKEEMRKAKDTNLRAKTLLELLNMEDKYGFRGLLEQNRSLSAITTMKYRGVTLDEMV